MKDGFISVEFQKNYSATRGPSISGAKGQVKQFRNTEALKELLNAGIVKPVKETREKATKAPKEKT